MSVQSEEVRKYFALNNIKITDVAEKTGISRPTLSNLICGRRDFSKRYAPQLAEAYGFDVTFLLTGQGSLFPQKPATSGTKDAELRAANEMVQQLTKDNISLKAKVYKLMEKLEALGQPCDDSPCKP